MISFTFILTLTISLNYDHILTETQQKDQKKLDRRVKKIKRRIKMK